MSQENPPQENSPVVQPIPLRSKSGSTLKIKVPPEAPQSSDPINLNRYLTEHLPVLIEPKDIASLHPEELKGHLYNAQAWMQSFFKRTARAEEQVAKTEGSRNTWRAVGLASLASLVIGLPAVSYGFYKIGRIDGQASVPDLSEIVKEKDERIDWLEREKASLKTQYASSQVIIEDKNATIAEMTKKDNARIRSLEKKLLNTEAERDLFGTLRQNAVENLTATEEELEAAKKYISGISAELEAQKTVHQPASREIIEAYKTQAIDATQLAEDAAALAKDAIEAMEAERERRLDVENKIPKQVPEKKPVEYAPNPRYIFELKEGNGGSYWERKEIPATESVGIGQHLDNAVAYTAMKYSSNPIGNAGIDLERGFWSGPIENIGDVVSGAHPVKGSIKFVFAPITAAGYLIKALVQDTLIGGSHYVLRGGFGEPKTKSIDSEEPEAEK